MSASSPGRAAYPGAQDGGGDEACSGAPLDRLFLPGSPHGERCFYGGPTPLLSPLPVIVPFLLVGPGFFLLTLSCHGLNSSNYLCA